MKRGIPLSSQARLILGAWLPGTYFHRTIALVLLMGSALVAENEAKAEPPRGTEVSVRLGAERAYGQWEREYEGQLAAPARAAYFSGTALEQTGGWRGRIDLLIGPEQAGIRGTFGPWIEVNDPVEHAVSIAGEEFRFQSAPILFGANGGLEIRFLKEMAFIGLALGVANVFESLSSPVGRVTGTSTRFSFLGRGLAGFRIPLSDVIALGATASAEYHVFIAATRLSGGIFLEIKP